VGVYEPVPGEKKTRLSRSTGVRGSRARCSLIDKSDRIKVFFYRLERACEDWKRVKRCAVRL
jgi:hypothetical protein